MNVLFTFGIQRMCLIDKVMLTEVQVWRVTLNVKFWRHECCVGQTSSEQCMLGQIQWMSSSLCNSALRLSTVERSSSFWEGSKCYTHMQTMSLSYFRLHYFCTTTGQRKRERGTVMLLTSIFPSSSILVSCWRTLLLVTRSTAVLRLKLCRENTHTHGSGLVWLLTDSCCSVINTQCCLVPSVILLLAGRLRSCGEQHEQLNQNMLKVSGGRKDLLLFLLKTGRWTW